MAEEFDKNAATRALNTPVPRESIRFFTEQPCARPFLGPSSAYKPLPITSQVGWGNATQTFFGETLKSPTGILHLLWVVHESLFETGTEKTETALSNANHPGTVMFVHIGSGLNGFQDSVHGGALATLIDEALGGSAAAFKHGMSKDSGPLATMKLNVSYKAPVMVKESASRVLVIKTWLRKREGRKWFVNAELCDEDGRVKVAAESLWLAQKFNPKL